MKSATVLIVEDHGPTRTVLAGTLDRMGEDVMMAANGAEAMAVLDHRDDIMLLVIGTLAAGGMNTAELRLLATERRPHLRILVAPTSMQESADPSQIRSPVPPASMWGDRIDGFVDEIAEQLSKLRY